MVLRGFAACTAVAALPPWDLFTADQTYVRFSFMLSNVSKVRGFKLVLFLVYWIPWSKALCFFLGYAVRDT